GVHAEALKRSADVRAEAVVTDLRDHGGPAPESCRADGDIGGDTPQGLLECSDLREGRADLLGVKVDAHPAHGDQVERSVGHDVVRHDRDAEDASRTARVHTRRAIAALSLAGDQLVSCSDISQPRYPIWTSARARPITSIP